MHRGVEKMSLTEKLIEHVKQYPILYDLGHEDYKNCRKKDKVWDQIALKLNQDGKIHFILFIGYIYIFYKLLKYLTNFSRTSNAELVARLISLFIS